MFTVQMEVTFWCKGEKNCSAGLTCTYRGRAPFLFLPYIKEVCSQRLLSGVASTLK